MPTSSASSSPSHSLPESARELLDYWFADGAGESPVRAEARVPLWFMATPEQDEEMRVRFGNLVEQALAGELDDWAVTPRGRLALVLLLDQLTRNLHRGTAKAFAGDAQALALSVEYIQSVPAGTDDVPGGSNDTLNLPEQMFMAVPLEHAEDAEVQRTSVAHAEAMLASAAPEWTPMVTEVLTAVREHAGIVERFGRFPHRNDVLGRSSTDLEQQYLDAGAERFGQ